LYLHVVFDQWISKAVRAKFAFERYADDIVIHAGTEESARFILKILKERFEKCGLEIHPEKSKLVQTELRREVAQKPEYGTSFDFLGHRFKNGTVKTKDGSIKLLYQLHIAPKSKKRILDQLQYAKLNLRTSSKLEELAQGLNAKIRGWVGYFGKFTRSSLQKVFAHINFRLVKWCMKKYKKYKGDALHWVSARSRENPALFVHWQQTGWFCYPFKEKASKR
jgi:RNA-directed DNA polymerase